MPASGGWRPKGGFARRQGLDLKMRAFDSDVVMIKALLAGELDSLRRQSDRAPMIATSKGGDLKILGCTWPKLTYSFFARPDSRSLADLRGKTIGISAPGSLPDLVARAMLGRIGHRCRRGARSWRPAATLSACARSRPRRIDAAVSTSDFAARPELGLKTLARANDILPSFLRACMVTRGDVWRKRPDELVRLLAATMNGYGHALTHRAETVALARRIAKLPANDPTPGREFRRGDRAIARCRRRSRSTWPKLLWLRDFLAEDRRLDPEFEPGTMIDRGVRAHALARIKPN